MGLVARTLGLIPETWKSPARTAVSRVVSSTAPAVGGRVSFAQGGEDLIALDWLEQHGVTRGVYVDVGAHHPVRLSNTYLLYRRGFRGVCIDPAREVAARFAATRPRDVFVTCAVDEHAGPRTLYTFDVDAYNSLRVEAHDTSVARGFPKPAGSYSVDARRLDDVLAETLPPLQRDGAPFAFLSIDVEGMDEAVVASNDWDRFRPRLVCVEVVDDGARALALPVVRRLLDAGYAWCAKTHISLFLADTR